MQFVIYGPSRIYGAGFRLFKTEQGIGQIQYLLKHWTSTLQPGIAQRIAISWAQMNTGVGWSVLEDVCTPLPHFESEWFRVLRDFLKSINSRIRLDNTYIPTLQRINDSYIMDHVLGSKMFQPTEIRQINYCRLYLQAVTVSDISTASGSQLFCGIHKGSTTGITSTTTWHHTVQKTPDTSSWKLWKKALAIFSTNGILHNPLYEWLDPPTQQRRKWTAYFDPQTNYLLFPCDEQYTVHFRCNQIYGIEPGATQTTLSEKSYPVDIRRTFDGWRIAKYSKILPPPPTPLSTTFHEYCSNLEPWESNLLTNASLNFPPEEIMLYLSTQAFRACSDGSAVSLQGTFGWVLALPDKTRLADLLTVTTLTRSGPRDKVCLVSFLKTPTRMDKELCSNIRRTRHR